MKDVFVVSDNIISPVGITSAANYGALLQNVSGVREQLLPAISPVPFFASLLPEDMFAAASDLTKFEQLMVHSINDALHNCEVDITAASTILIISSTKGNITLLENGVVDDKTKTRIGLPASAARLKSHFNLANMPVVVSNACISGLTALLTGKRLLEAGLYRHAVVVGADVISSFIMSGFQSFQAVSAEPCRPFDAARKGINLGEAGATIILSTEKINNAVRLTGGGISNDANHISGPSRSGQELCIAIHQAIKQANVQPEDIGFISAHGTATIYNDEMEAKAFSLAGLEHVPLNSLKGYYGHTLGAAGIVESVIAIHSLQNGTVIPTRGFEQTGVSKPVTICKELTTVNTRHCLKTASGFGGCNAALVFSKTLN